MTNTTKNNMVSVIKGPKITEKAGIKAESQNVYTFEVTKEATKKKSDEARENIAEKTKPSK